MIRLTPSQTDRHDRWAWRLDAAAGLVGAVLALAALALVVQWCC